MPTFQLFRIKVVERSRQELLPFQGADTLPKRDVIRAAIEERPSSEFRAGHTWRIGNVESVDSDAVYFALGRTTRYSLELFDEESGNFLVTAIENSPSTHVFIDLRFQTCAIAKRPELAQSVERVAGNLAKLLSQTNVAEAREVDVEIDVIPDPDDFIAVLRRAYQVVTFTMEFSRPNPWDVERDLQKPLEDTLAKIGGNAGATTFKGSALVTSELASLAHAVAATGNDARARLRTSKSAKLTTKRLRGSAVTLTAEDEEDLAAMRPKVLTWIREQYERVRGNLFDRR